MNPSAIFRNTRYRTNPVPSIRYYFFFFGHRIGFFVLETIFTIKGYFTILTFTTVGVLGSGWWQHVHWPLVVTADRVRRRQIISPKKRQEIESLIESKNPLIHIPAVLSLLLWTSAKFAATTVAMSWVFNILAFFMLWWWLLGLMSKGYLKSEWKV